MAWLFLTVAIVAEVAATLALKASDGFTRFWPGVLVITGYGLAFVTLGQALRTIGVGPAYALWSGLGTVGAALGGWLIFSERMPPLTVAGMAVIVTGVVIMNLGGAGH
jgi:small multidrug resistance pump